MKRYRWQIILGITLLAPSALLYFMHFMIFRDTYHIFIYMLGDIAFIPIEVLIITLIIDRVLAAREKRAMLEKLNMVIGAFYSEVGLKLIYYFSCFDLNTENIKIPRIRTTNAVCTNRPSLFGFDSLCGDSCNGRTPDLIKINAIPMKNPVSHIN